MNVPHTYTFRDECQGLEVRNTSFLWVAFERLSVSFYQKELMVDKIIVFCKHYTGFLTHFSKESILTQPLQLAKENNLAHAKCVKTSLENVRFILTWQGTDFS